MQRGIGFPTRVFANPWVYGSVAALVVLAAIVFAAAHVRVYRDASLATPAPVMERVTVARSSVYAPPAVGSEAGVPAPQVQIAQAGHVSLYVTNLDSAVTELTHLANVQGGGVFALSVNNGDGTVARPNGQMQLRVPAKHFDATMDAVAKAGKVRERSSNAQDLTGNITDSSARLRNLRRTEADIRRIMDRSGNVSQVMDAENQLSQVREQIETLQSEVKAMRGRVTYSTIDVTMETEAAAASVQPTAAAQLQSAWRDAVGALRQTTIGIASLILWLFAFAPYAAALLIAGWLVYRRRSRTAAP